MTRSEQHEGKTMKVKPNIQELSIRSLTVDHALQSRVQTSPEVVKEYTEAKLSGAIFPPIVVFFDGTKYRVADGFHRVETFKKAGCVSIHAEVKEGGFREALLYSAGANAKMGQRPTAEDKRKAVRMLLGDAEYFMFADSVIAAMCGVSSPTAKKYRLEWCAENNVALPQTAQWSRKDRDSPIVTSRSRSPLVSRGMVATVHHAHAGRLSGAMSLVNHNASERQDAVSATSDTSALGMYLLKRGIRARSIGQQVQSQALQMPDGSLACVCQSMSREAMAIAVGRLLIASKSLGEHGKLFVVYDADAQTNWVSGLVRVLAHDPLPIECVTPDALARMYTRKPQENAHVTAHAV